MKLTHFAVFAPHGAGQYETVKDLILAERSVGIDAQFIDFAHDGTLNSRTGLRDGEITTMPASWVDEADLVVSHSAVPRDILKRMPSILALHGRPEYSFRLEFNKVSPVISSIVNKAQANRYSAYITFWPEFLFPWSRILAGRTVHYIPSPVDFATYTPEGDRHIFAENGSPNIVIADMWREDVIPFNLIIAAQYFREHYAPKAKLHIYGLDKSSAFSVLRSFKALGLLGELRGIVGNLPMIYRAADMVITPNIIATRIIRESLASGTPIVAPVGCTFTAYQAEPRDYRAFASAMWRCWQALPDPQGLRQQMVERFNPRIVGETMRKLCESILSRTQWNGMSILPADWRAIERIVKTHAVKSVVEFGSGISTQLFERLGLRVRSYETSREQIAATRKRAPRSEYVLWDGKTIPELNGADMALIDGPHKGVNREPAYRAVAESKIPLVLCHDKHRPEDRQWMRKYFMDWEVLPSTPKTLAVFKRA